MKPGVVINIYIKGKKRPCVIVSPERYNKHGTDVLVVPITSNLSRTDPEDILVDTSHPAYAQMGLSTASVIRCGKIAAYDLRAGAWQRGTVPESLLTEILETLTGLFN